MIYELENTASWAIIFGSAIGVLGILQSVLWITALGICISTGSAIVALYFRRKQQKSSGLSIEGLNLDSLKIANLRRRLNRSLVVERALHLAVIEGADLNVAWQYDGFCRSHGETGIEFSIDTENNIPFEKLDCFAFDIQNDPERVHKIRPLLVGGDGVSKKIRVPFLQPPTVHQPFSILLNCRLPGCVTSGIQYYTSSFSFDQPAIASTAVHLIFASGRPDSVRVYECRKRGRPTLIRTLRPFRDDGVTCEYVDMEHNAPGQSVHIYVYDPVPSYGTNDARKVVRAS